MKNLRIQKALVSEKTFSWEDANWEEVEKEATYPYPGEEGTLAPPGCIVPDVHVSRIHASASEKSKLRLGAVYK